MQINGENYHTIWSKEKTPVSFQAIDQRKLPFQFEFFDLITVEDAFFAIREMVVRGAPLIGVTAACGMFLAMVHYKGSDFEGFIREKAG